jgi:hypothetical protein
MRLFRPLAVIHTIRDYETDQYILHHPGETVSSRDAKIDPTFNGRATASAQNGDKLDSPKEDEDADVEVDDMGVIRKKTATRGGEGGVKYVCDVCSADITSTVSLIRLL